MLLINRRLESLECCRASPSPTHNCAPWQTQIPKKNEYRIRPGSVTLLLDGPTCKQKCMTALSFMNIKLNNNLFRVVFCCGDGGSNYSTSPDQGRSINWNYFCFMHKPILNTLLLHIETRRHFYNFLIIQEVQNVVAFHLLLFSN